MKLNELKPNPKRVKDLEDRDDIASHPVIDSAKNIVDLFTNLIFIFPSISRI